MEISIVETSSSVKHLSDRGQCRSGYVVIFGDCSVSCLLHNLLSSFQDSEKWVEADRHFFLSFLSFLNTILPKCLHRSFFSKNLWRADVPFHQTYLQQTGKGKSGFDELTGDL